MFFFIFLKRDDDFLFLGGQSVLATIAAVIVLGAVEGRGSLLLSSPALVLTGRWSYGIYLWHFPVFVFIEKFVTLPIAGILAEWALTFISAGISFYLIERPVLKLKSKFQT